MSSNPEIKKEIGEIEYFDAFNECLTADLTLVKEYEDNLRSKIKALEEKLIEKKSALESTVNDANHEILMAEIKNLELSLIVRQKTLAGVLAALQERNEE